MRVKNWDRCAEKHINNEDYEKSVMMSEGASSYEQFYLNTVKRLMNFWDGYQSGSVSKDVFLISLRNYLLVSGAEMTISEDAVLRDNAYGIRRNVEGKYYATMDLPDYIDNDFVEQAFQRRGVQEGKKDQEDVFYGTNSFIHKLTGFVRFKSLEQKLAVFGALNTPDGYTTLVSLPTGGGKSLITQTMAYQKEGLTVVVVPTVSLAMDQVRNAKRNLIHDATEEVFCYHSGMEDDEKQQLKDALRKETARLIFISPEALIRNREFSGLIKAANERKILKNLIIDEAHIVIEWGDFFRVEYQCLEGWRKELMVVNSQLRTILLSATFTRNSVVKLRQMFSASGKWIEIRCDALRREPRFALVKAKSYTDKRSKLLELVKKLPHPMIVYVNSPDEAEDIKALLARNGINGVETFTGKTKSAQRKTIIQDWSDDKFDLIVATSAFGVGVDKPDVRTVLHLYVPNTPNQYYQELGRGGRDGLVSLSVMCIHAEADVDAAYKRMGKVLSPEKIWGRWKSMYADESSVWSKGKVTLNTDVKPRYNVTQEDDEASDIDIQWNVYVLLLLRRHNLIDIKSMTYIRETESYTMRVDILDDSLREEDDTPPDSIKRVRDKEYSGFDMELRRLKNGILRAGSMCWSEMFSSTYDKVSGYCGGCGAHQFPESMEEGRFPLLVPVRAPIRSTLPEFDLICQQEKEVLVIGDTKDYNLINRFLGAGVCAVILEDSSLEHNKELIQNMSSRSNTMFLGMREYRGLSEKSAEYYLSGGALALYNTKSDKTQIFCNTLRKYQLPATQLVHVAKEDFFLQKVQKTLSAMIDGPRIDSYILERM